MTLAQAKRILHPETSQAALAEIYFYAGFGGETAKKKAIDEACIVACEAMEKLEKIQKWTEGMRV